MSTWSWYGNVKRHIRSTYRMSRIERLCDCGKTIHKGEKYTRTVYIGFDELIKAHLTCWSCE